MKDYPGYSVLCFIYQSIKPSVSTEAMKRVAGPTGLGIKFMILKLPLKLKPRFNEPWIVLNQFWKKIQVNGLGNLSFKLTYSRMSMVPKILVKILHIFKLLTKALGPWLYFKEEKREAQASSPKQQASSSRPQATSSKI